MKPSIEIKNGAGGNNTHVTTNYATHLVLPQPGPLWWLHVSTVVLFAGFAFDHNPWSGFVAAICAVLAFGQHPDSTSTKVDK